MPVVKVNAPPLRDSANWSYGGRRNGSTLRRVKLNAAHPGVPRAEVTIEWIASVIDGPPGSVRGT